MPGEPNADNHASEEDLLADAIPIPADEDEEEELTPIDVAPATSQADDSQKSSKIRTFGKQTRHVDNWNRTPNITGKGAIHVKTFVTKLRLDAIEHLDEQINEWLDNHPEYEVKMATTSVGKLVGKTTEDALLVNVWV